MSNPTWPEVGPKLLAAIKAERKARAACHADPWSEIAAFTLTGARYVTDAAIAEAEALEGENSHAE